MEIRQSYGRLISTMRFSILVYLQSIIFHAIYGIVCIQLTHVSYHGCQNTCTCLTIIIKSEVWPICHYLGQGHETMCWLSFYTLTISLYLSERQISTGLKWGILQIYLCYQWGMTASQEQRWITLPYLGVTTKSMLCLPWWCVLYRTELWSMFHVFLRKAARLIH